MENKTCACKFVNASYIYHPLPLKIEEINSALNLLNLTVNSTKAYKLFYLKMRLQSLSIQEAVEVLVDSWFSDKINAEKRALYKYKLLTDVEYLFAHEPYQRELININNLIASLFDKQNTSQPITDISFIHLKESKISPLIIFKELVKNCRESSKMKKWRDLPITESLATNLILELTPYLNNFHRILINSYWIKQEDLIINHTGIN